MKIYNNNERFGWSGPFEVDSVEDHMHGMAPVFWYWSGESGENVSDLIAEYLKGLTIEID